MKQGCMPYPPYYLLLMSYHKTGDCDTVRNVMTVPISDILTVWLSFVVRADRTAADALLDFHDGRDRTLQDTSGPLVEKSLR